MTNDEIERILEFVIKQQEVFADNMAKADERMTRLEGAFVGLFDIVSQSLKVQKETVERLNELAEQQKALAKRQDELTEALKHTDERLNTLINVVERYFSNGQGGGARN